MTTYKVNFADTTYVTVTADEIYPDYGGNAVRGFMIKANGKSIGYVPADRLIYIEVKQAGDYIRSK